MADLKLNSTVGGLPIWHQGNFPLYPANNTLLYKTYKVYTENDKPQAADNDFVSKANGGIYLKNVTFNEGLSFKDSSGDTIVLKSDKSPTTGTATYTASLKLTSQFAFVTGTGTPFILFDPAAPDTNKPRLVVMGDITGRYLIDESGRAYSPGNKPNKTDVGLPNVINELQVSLTRADIQNMTGNLSAPNFISRNPASIDNHVPRFDQIVVRDAIQDFGSY